MALEMNFPDNGARLRYLLEELVPHKRFERLDEFVHEDVVLPPSFPGEGQGRDAYKAALSAVTGIRYTHRVEEVLSQGDRVAVRMIVEGYHVGEFLGLPATGLHFSFEQMVIARFSEGRVAQFWSVADVYALRDQLTKACRSQ